MAKMFIDDEVVCISTKCPEGELYHPDYPLDITVGKTYVIVAIDKDGVTVTSDFKNELEYRSARLHCGNTHRLWETKDLVYILKDFNFENLFTLKDDYVQIHRENQLKKLFNDSNMY